MSQYIPGAQDPVVGVVIARSGENYRVDIGAAHPATLDALAFEGASKRFRPNLKVPFLLVILKPFGDSRMVCT